MGKPTAVYPFGVASPPGADRSAASPAPRASGGSAGGPTAGPIRIPPPGSVRIAAILVGLEGVGLVVLAATNLFSGISHHADGAQLGAQVAYFVILGGLLGLVAGGLLRGRRWARTPALVAEIVVFAIGMWMAFPSAQLARGIAIMGAGAAIFIMLITPRANHWIKQFPAPFGIGEDQ